MSQGQPTLNRTWIPTQDSPGIRQTWSAKVTAPEPLKVVMSGERLTPDGEPAGDGRRAYRFRMDKPVAPYLIAIAAGDLAFRELGPRTGVWTEPAMLDRAAAELTDTEKMVEAAEKLYGPYRWGRYDVIVLPPSFPYGGMENPTLTFLTPTFIAGDKSLVGLVAHELAHSWSGQSGDQCHLGRQLAQRGLHLLFREPDHGGDLRPPSRRAGGRAQLRRNDGRRSRKRAQMHPTPGCISSQPKPIPTAARAASSTTRARSSCGRSSGWSGASASTPGSRSYFDRHAFQPMTSAKFLADFRENLVKGDKALEDKLLLDQWVYEPGLPANVARPDPAAFADVDKAVASFAGGGATPAEFDQLDDG